MYAAYQTTQKEAAKPNNMLKNLEPKKKHKKGNWAFEK